jgi:hypothetical protein
MSLDQGIGVAALPVVAFSQGFEDVHGRFLSRLWVLQSGAYG